VAGGGGATTVRPVEQIVLDMSSEGSFVQVCWCSVLRTGGVLRDVVRQGCLLEVVHVSCHWNISNPKQDNCHDT